MLFEINNQETLNSQEKFSPFLVTVINCHCSDSYSKFEKVFSRLPIIKKDSKNTKSEKIIEFSVVSSNPNSDFDYALIEIINGETFDIENKVEFEVPKSLLENFKEVYLTEQLKAIKENQTFLGNKITVDFYKQVCQFIS